MSETKYYKLKLARGAGTDVAKRLPAIEVAGHTLEPLVVICGMRSTVSVVESIGDTGWKPATWEDWQEAESRARKEKAKSDKEAAALANAKRYGIAVEHDVGYSYSRGGRTQLTVWIIRATKAEFVDHKGRRYHRRESARRFAGGRIGSGGRRGYTDRIDVSAVEKYLNGRERADIMKERKAAGDSNPEAA